MTDAEYRDNLNLLGDGSFRKMEASSAPPGPSDWRRSITTFIADHPELALGMALVLGAGVGLLLKRR